jgi:hypothetical protein
MAAAAPMILPSAVTYDRKWKFASGIFVPQLNLQEFLDLNYQIVRNRRARGESSTIDIFCSNDPYTIEQIQKAGIELKFVNVPENMPEFSLKRLLDECERVTEQRGIWEHLLKAS